MKKLLLLIVALYGIAQAQTPYAFSPIPRPTFVDANGVPLAGGFLYTYAAGTSTPLATYHIDTLGNITANPNPLILAADGSAEIRLLPQAYKFVLQNSQGVQIWAIDQIQDYGQLFYSQAVLLAPPSGALQTILGPISVTSLQFGSGAPLPTTTSGSGSFCLTTNCGMTNPLVNGVPILNGLGVYLVLANASTGTSSYGPVKLAGAPSTATGSLTSDTGGIVGICISTCGTSGNSVIQGSGVGACDFDGPTVAGDYVQNSSIGAHQCHDAGSIYPAIGQVLGRTLATVSGSQIVGVYLFGPEIQGASGSAAVVVTNPGGGGTGSTVVCGASECTNGAGQLAVTTGASPFGGQFANISFGGGVTPGHEACTFSPANPVAAGVSSGVFELVNSTGMTLDDLTPLAASTLYVWNYLCSFN